ncbi:hypothetical protein JTE90_028213 [Oedothorax gibbosus]|uniref:Transmembrane protein n=1 Tax=Oedothorax gibbosus TaxID=931172 RepID=A0AAV6TU06_9ARAC|nr:hypothetical protein JTE90_028213 [Oedothorax gibbosus]
MKSRLTLHLQEKICKSNIRIITRCEMTSNNLKSERCISVNEKKSNLIVEVTLGVCVCESCPLGYVFMVVSILKGISVLQLLKLYYVNGGWKIGFLVLFLSSKLKKTYDNRSSNPVMNIVNSPGGAPQGVVARK